MPLREAPLRHARDLLRYRRRKTRVVRVGKVPLGGDHPIRVQSMTTTDTLDVEATIAQSLRMVEAGCELVRVTAPTVADARALGKIKEGLLQRGVDVPLVADIHFAPAAALEAAEFVEKVRINPGNFVDNKRFAVKEYSDAEYDAELGRIEAAVTPLVEKLKRLGRALRIGTNHGSLSDRIMNRYGDSAAGMVESALEYVRVCEKLGFRDIVLSMKASNPKVMIAAYRLLAARMDEAGMDYPFHLGVTEAGDGEDGRVKSAIGIGSLLEDGIGDTLRVSLTEPPELEVPVCYALARRYQPAERPARERAEVAGAPEPGAEQPLHCGDLFDYARRKSEAFRVGPFFVGGPQLVRVALEAPAGATGAGLLALLEAQLKKSQEPELVVWTVRGPEDLARLRELRRELAGETSRLAFWARFHCDAATALAGLDAAELASWPAAPAADRARFAAALARKSLPLAAEAESVDELLAWDEAARGAGVPAVLGLLGSDVGLLLRGYRLLAARLAQRGSRASLHLRAPRQGSPEDQVLQSSLLIGGLLCDGLGDSIQVDAAAAPERALELSYNVLQAGGVRITKTEFVSCPSCGRTLFDLQETTERIKAKTGHLKGVKIAIMGCIVNGPGEMADADFGYVGGAPDRINLYVGKDCVQKGIPSEAADQALVDLIRKHGKWVEP
ncbi:MAG: (E)-4-hydroxy-3-methylbut-2-enyl-diphosphate synthase [Elusimicrobia bacterium]|nr:(E)-4-hydroxy-3-methylbut-2-enyl-diphosphate synthase [Elusimicrobiota bacterium]